MRAGELTLRVPLRWRDMDMLGHLNQAVYHELLEEGRDGLMRELCRPAGSSEDAWVVARVELDHRHEVRREDEVVDLVVRVERVGTKSVTLGHDVRLPDGTLAATGRTVLVGWDPAARAGRTIAPAERERLEAAAQA